MVCFGNLHTPCYWISHILFVAQNDIERAQLMKEPQINLEQVGVYFRTPRDSRLHDKNHFRLANWSTRNDKEWALLNVSLSFEAGETVAVLGRNGAGKTTLLNVLEGQLIPDKGTCFTSVKPYSMRSLMSGFHNHSSVRENTITLGRLRGVGYADAKEFASEVIKFAGLVEKANHPYGSLSTGMKARLGFSFAHIFEPEILLIDEGLANGDRWFRDQSQNSISRYLGSGKTILMTGHSERLLRQTCARGIVLTQGQILFDGPIDRALKFYHSKG
jgi:ABC-type polysaccharide/polyol phosphate transport system ATPase subunit